MNIRTLCDTLQPLFDLSTEVMETNFHYQCLLAERIQKAGKPLEQMTLAEVRQLVDRQEQFRMFAVPGTALMWLSVLLGTTWLRRGP